MQPLLHLIRKEFRQVFRDRDMVRIIFIAPLIQLFVFGYAANTDLENAVVGVLDDDRTPASRAVVEAFRGSDVFSVGSVARDGDGLAHGLTRGDVDLTVWIPRGFERARADGRAPQMAITVDGQNSSLAGRALGYASRIVRDTAGDTNGSSRPGGRIELATRYFYNPELESRFYMVPGIVVLVITVISALLTGMSVVREREVGTLEQLLVTPLTPFQLIAGKTIPFALIAFFELTFATIVAILWFRLPLAGSVWLLALTVAIYLLVTLGVGLLSSTVSSTQQQAMFTVWFFLVFGILLSGFFFPIENMPRWAQLLTIANPLRYVMDVVRGIFLRGATLADVWRDLVILTGMGLAVFTLAVHRFQKRVG